MILADSAEPVALAGALGLPFVAGFTTNPALVARATGCERIDLCAYLDRVASLLVLAAAEARCRHVMVQVAGQAELWEGQIAGWAGQTAEWRQKGGTLWVKLPPSAAGLALCEASRRKGLSPLVTAVFTAAQAAASLEAGAAGGIVYLRRMQDDLPDWRDRLSSISRILGQREGLLLLASVPTVRHFEDGVEFSRDITAAPPVLARLLDADLSAAALAAFESAILASPGATRT